MAITAEKQADAIPSHQSGDDRGRIHLCRDEGVSVRSVDGAVEHATRRADADEPYGRTRQPRRGSLGHLSEG